MFKHVILAALCLGMAACQQAPPVQAVETIVDLPSNGDQAGALSGGAVPTAPVKAASLESGNWPAVQVSSGDAFVSCSAEPQGDDQGHALHDLSYASVSTLVRPCIKTGTVRLRYQGKIASDFTALVERVASIANRLRIETRILDLDSSGGHVEEAMKAGDFIGATRWLLSVREDAICHSACVLLLAAGRRPQDRWQGRHPPHDPRRLRCDTTAPNSARSCARSTRRSRITWSAMAQRWRWPT